MTFKSYIARMETMGDTIVKRTDATSKLSNESMILHSPTRREVVLNDATTPTYCLVSDKEGFQKREFQFVPDTKIFKGDYIHYDGLTYLITNNNLDEILPKAEAQLCNFEFPITVGTERKQIGMANNRPKYEEVPIIVKKPCVLTVKSYSSLDNSSIGQVDVNVIVLMPYSSDYAQLPKTNTSIMVENSQYKVVENTFQNVFTIDGVKRGYIETRLQGEAVTNV